MREEGFYKVKVQEFGPPFWTIGLWTDYGPFQSFCFAQGDGNEQSTSYTILEVDEKMIMKDRVYE